MISTFKQFVNEQLLNEYTKNDVTTLKTHMNKRKVKHSCNVALMLHDLYYTKDTYNAALYHDFVERGGTVAELLETIGEYATSLVLAITKTDEDENSFDSDNMTLDLLKSKLHKYAPQMQNEIILIKLCDRVDNLRKRRKKGDLTKKYAKKSAQLIDFLYCEYTGTNKPGIRAFIEKKVLRHHPKMKVFVEESAPLVDAGGVNQVTGEHVLAQQNRIF